jgi:hypothetical protein
MVNKGKPHHSFVYTLYFLPAGEDIRPTGLCSLISRNLRRGLGKKGGKILARRADVAANFNPT